MLSIALSLFALSAPASPSVQCGPAADLPEGRARVAIELTRDDGKPIPGATVYLSNDPYEGEFKSDAKGLVRARGLAPGEYLLLATHEQGDAQTVFTVGAREQCLVRMQIGSAAARQAQAEAEIEVGPAPGPALAARLESSNDQLQLGEESDPNAVARYQKQRERGQTLRGAGIGVIALGGALAVGSPLAWIVGPCGGDGASTPNCQSDTRTQLVVGFAVAGGLTVAGGIAMVAIGAKRTRKARESLRASAVPTRGGAHFALRGRF